MHLDKRKVANRLEALQITAYEVSKRSGLSLQSTYNLLDVRVTSNPTLRTLSALARGLECHAISLLDAQE